MLAFITKKPLVGKSCTSDDNIKGKKRLFSVGRDCSPRFSNHFYLKDWPCLQDYYFVNLRQTVFIIEENLEQTWSRSVLHSSQDW